ncbi:PH domain-containing protein [Haloquadratum walsbyi]|jgi:Predicted membrane protein|uniref:Putative membrane protein n=1 Tax=Haloquadratum walsbyi J07HQW2 TaxID=1238425 RepID=U1NJK2_9EURY|nr:PH domain-containing protein [Haloquadratum walsbyi]ERG97128.1 MAG: putative membrane protein [Haloquadratum walsbyi J07HQW2]
MSEEVSQDVSGRNVADTADADLDLDWLTLEEGESIQWVSTPHQYSMIPAFVIGIPLSIILIGIPIIVGSYLRYTNTNYVITNRGLYSKRGIISMNVQQIGFEKVQNTSYSQSALGSSLGYGSVDISTAGGSGVELQFRSIPNPASVQELVAREIDTRRQGDSDSTSNTDDVLDAILQELQTIRSAVTDDETNSDTEGIRLAGNHTSAKQVSDNEDSEDR